MISLKEALFSRKNLPKQNPFGLTKDDLEGCLSVFPMGIVVKLVEETLKQNSYIDTKDAIKFLKKSAKRGFMWTSTEDGFNFWQAVIDFKRFDFFFEKYPEYEKYNFD